MTCDLAVSEDDIDSKVLQFFIKDTEMDLDLDEPEPEEPENAEDKGNDEEEESDLNDEEEEAIYDRTVFDNDPDDILANLFDTQEDEIEAGCYRTSYHDDIDTDAEISDYEDQFG